MKDLNTYLKSGILEQYILGDLSKEEMLEVEKYAAQYPEVRHELEEIENALQNYAEHNAIEPSARNRSRIIDVLEFADTKTKIDVPVRPIERTSGGVKFYKYAFAASLGLLFISIVLLINLNKKLKESHNQIAILESGNQKFSNQVNYIERELSETKNTLQYYQNPASYKLITLKGSEKAPKASVIIAFNPDREEIMIDMSNLKIPLNDDEHQYQLWAIVNGKPVDLGVFDSESTAKGMKKMKSVKSAQAFAVTLEPRGGSVNPSLEQMMAVGNI
ncbi:MAG: anti-sigma factor [Pedobacter sp.]